MTALDTCPRCGRELVGLPSPCATCSGASMLDPAWTPEAGYSHAQGLLAALEREERAQAAREAAAKAPLSRSIIADGVAANEAAQAAAEAAQALLLASVDRVLEVLPTPEEARAAARQRYYGPGSACRTPMAARRRAQLDALCDAPGDSPYTDLDSDAREQWA